MLRRFRLRFRKAAAVTALAMGLSVSLVVSTPQNAQAFVPPAAIAGPVVLGAAPAVLGTAATGVLVASGVGLVIMAGVFVMAAHANGVFKFPWEDNPVNTEDGEVTEDIPTETPSGIVETGVGRNIRSTPDMVIGTPFIEGEYLNFPLTYSGEIPLFMGTAYKQVSFMGTLELTCRLPETGEVVKDVRRVFQGTWTNSAAVGNQFGQTRVYKAKCQNFNAVMTDALLRPMTPEEYAAAKSTVDGNGASTFRGPGEESFWKGEGTAYENPEMRTRVDCVAPDGTRVQLEATTPAETGEIEIPSCAEAGLGVAEAIVTDFLDGGKVRSAPMIDLRKGDTSYINCDPVFGQICMLEIFVDGKRCTIGAPDCTRWASIARAQPDRVECRYGNHIVDVSLCGIMEGAYVRGGSPVIEENVDGDPDTWVNPGVIPGWHPHVPGPDGKPMPDPDWIPGESPYPSPETGGGTNPGTNPGTSPGTTPGTGGQPGEGASPNESACFPQGWAMFNPVEWVMRPVGCALREAFVPEPQVVNEVSARLNTKIESVGLSNVANSWLVTYESAGGGSGCMGPPVNFKMNGVTENMHPFQACTAPMSTVAAVSYGVSTLVIVLFGGLGIVRAIGAAFGFNFSMGKGGDDD